ncbi:MAG: RraA family protein, partial [Candidatus Korobacteraceae bacterium]
ALQEWVTVAPGDQIVCDEDGVIVVPQHLLSQVVDKVVAWASTESESREAIQQGLPLLAALEKYGHL